MGNNSANISQAAGVCMGTCVAGKYLQAPNLVLPGGNRSSQHRVLELGEKEHFLVSPGPRGKNRSLPLEAGREQGDAPHPTELLLHMN